MSDPAPARILVVDDHAIVRHGLAQLLARHPDLAICGEAGGYDEALAAAAELHPDIVLVDITLKDRSGLDLIRELRDRHPGMRCLVLSMHDAADYAERSLRAGARGYVRKEDADEVIVEAIRAVLRGDVYASPEVSAQVLRRFADGGVPPAGEAGGIGALTERELEVFHCLGGGLSTKRIAEKFGLSARTVEVHRANIKRKLGCEDTAQMLREAVRWVERQREG
jgi:DNA-binding NarL/FixJ family response regulator